MLGLGTSAADTGQQTAKHVVENIIRRASRRFPSDCLECSSPFRKFEEQPTGMEDGTTCSGTGTFNETQSSDQGQLEEVGIDDRLMSLHLLLLTDKFSTIVLVYVLPSPNEASKNNFYEGLHALLATVPKVDKWNVLDDFNARVGTEFAAWRGMFAPQGLGCFFDDSLLLLRTCAGHRLILTNTFRFKMREKATWMHSRSRH
ncbi:unnamed protein product [Schistocephalus solidus]|uniref:Uncharacterized protein n=1 Tax=Schistocephalus solidus TaxID=70667 RepID=A0A183T2H1_SCHSO|nr:unnamed protein product [Schistocephalus solidus]